MVIFNKTNSAISSTLNYFKEDTRFEGEICFLIETQQIIGVGFGLDLTHAKIQNHLKSKGLPWERAKSFDGSAVLGDFVPFDGEFQKLSMKLYINNKLIQFATHELMMYKPEIMIEEIQSFMCLEDGDIIMSGTPKGVGTYDLGDSFKGQIFNANELLVESSWVVA